MYIKTQIVLLLFGVQLYYGYSIAKIQIENGTETYEVRELPNKTVEFVNPKRDVPTMREITYYRVIEKPYFPKNYYQNTDDLEEEPDFDESLRPFTNSHGYQFIGWGAQDENNPDEDTNATTIASNSSTNNTGDASIDKEDLVDEEDETNNEGNEDITKNKIDENEDNNESEELGDDYNDKDDKEKHTDSNDSIEYYEEKDDGIHKSNDKNKGDAEYLDEMENVTEKKNEEIFIDSTHDDKKIDEKSNNSNENNKTNNVTVKSNDDKIEKTGFKNKTDDIVKKLRNKLFNSTKEKYINIKRQQENVTATPQTRRKREAIFSDIPEAPKLPDLDVAAFPDYLRRMLANRPRIHITYNEKTHDNNPSNIQSRLEGDDEDVYYDLPEPKIEIRNNFSDDEEVEGKDENEEGSRKTRNIKEHFKLDKDDQTGGDSHIFHNKLSEMFETIEKRFTKDGKKPRTYGMNLIGDSTQMWNDMTGTSIEVNEKKDNSGALNKEPDSKSNEVNYKDDDTEETETFKNILAQHEKKEHLREPVPIESEKFMEDTLLPPQNPASSNEKLASLMQLPDLKIDHIEQIPRVTVNLDENQNQEDNILPTSAPHDLKINRNLEHIPDKNDIILSNFLPDLKIEHTEQIPRVYRKAENTSPSASDQNTEEIIKSSTKATAISNKIGKTTEIPSYINVKSQLDNKDLKLKMEEAFDNILKRFHSFEPGAKDSKIEPDSINLKENMNSKTYGIRLEGDHGYIWNDFNNAGKPINIGNIENVSTTEANLEVTPSSEINKDHLVENDSEQSIEITTSENERNTDQSLPTEPPKEEFEVNIPATIANIGNPEINTKNENKKEVDVTEIDTEIITKRPAKTTNEENKKEETTEIKIESESITEKSNEINKKEGSNKTENDKKDGTEIEEKHNEVIEKPKNTAQGDMESTESVDKKDLNTTMTIKNDTEVKLALDDLLKRDEFWKWLSDWSTTYLEVLNERNKILVKNEIARQLEVQNNLSYYENVKDDVEQDKNATVNIENIPKNNTINETKIDTSRPNENVKKNTTNILIKENLNPEKLDNNKGNTSEIKGTMCKNKKSNSPFTINDKTIYGSAVASGNASNIFIFYPDENDKTVQNKVKTDNQISSEPNLIIDKTLGCDTDDGLEKVGEKKQSSQDEVTIGTENYAQTNMKLNTSPLTVNAETIYGSAVATDHVTNIFIFYPNKAYNQAMEQIGPVLDKVKSENRKPADLAANVTFDERLGTDEDKPELVETETEKYHLTIEQAKPGRVNDINHKLSDQHRNNSNNIITSSEPFEDATTESNIVTTTQSYGLQTTENVNFVKERTETNKIQDTATNTHNVTVSEDAITTIEIPKKEPTELAENEIDLAASTHEGTATSQNKSKSATKDHDNSVTATETSNENSKTADNITTIDINITDSDDGVTSKTSDTDVTKANDLTILTDIKATDSNNAVTTTENSDIDATIADDKTVLADKDPITSDDKTTLTDKDATTTDNTIALLDKAATTADDQTALANTTADDKTALPDKDAITTDDNTTLTNKDVIPTDNTIALPDKAATTANDQTASTNKDATTADDNTTLTNKDATTTDITIALPDKAATAADDQTTLTDKDATTPDDKTALPYKDAVTPDDNTMLTDKDAKARDDTVALPDKDATLMDDKTFTDKYAATADETTALVVTADNDVADDKTKLPDKDVPVPDDAETTSENPHSDSANSELTSDVKAIETDKKEKTDEDPNEISKAPAKK